ncbi:hypothetical protein V2T44_17005 [Serratia ficaria]|nr:hypothetical protein [Serratia ficaria]
MSALKIAVLVTNGCSPFHFSVPCILFGPAMQEPRRGFPRAITPPTINLHFYPLEQLLESLVHQLHMLIKGPSSVPIEKTITLDTLASDFFRMIPP